MHVYIYINLFARKKTAVLHTLVLHTQTAILNATNNPYGTCW